MHEFLQPVFKFFHLICGTTFFGIIIATFFYITRSIYQEDRTLITYSVKASYFGDAIIFMCILVQLVTATKLVSAGNFTLAIPWIFIAYFAFGTLILLWMINMIVKINYFSKPLISSAAIKIFYLLNIMMILIFILIIHDAVTQSTWFDFLFRK